METNCKNSHIAFNIIRSIVLSVLAAVAFSTDISISNFSAHSNITLADNTLLWSVFVIVLTCAYVRVFSLNIQRRDKAAIAVLSVFFGFGNVIGHSLYFLDSWDFLFGNGYQIMIGSACAIGYAGLFLAAGLLLFHLLDSYKIKETDNKPNNHFLKLIDERPFLMSSLIIGLVLLLWLVIYFPGYTNNDLNYQLQQYYGKEVLTNSHPVLSTAIIGTCMQLGKLLHHDALGLFSYMLLQAAVFVYAFGTVCRLSKQVKLGYGLRIGILAFYAILPVWGAYSVQAMKDGLFTGIFTIFVTKYLSLYIIANEGEIVRLSHVIRLVFVSILTCLLRSAACFIVVPSLLFLSFSINNKLFLRKIILSTLITGAISFGFIYLLLPALGVIKCNKAESLSIPFQQVARIVRDHYNGIEENEYSAINDVLDYDSLPDIYLPVLSDPVKDTYKQRELETESEALSKFKKTWIKLAGRYPATALQATIANNYGYFSFTPSIQTSNGHTGMCFFLSDDKNNGQIQTDTYSISYPKALKPVRKLVLTASYLVDAVPGVNLLYACAFYFWMIMLFSLYILLRGKVRLFGICSPFVLLQLGCLGSSVNDCFRYEAPLAAALPILLLAAVYVSKKRKGLY